MLEIIDIKIEAVPSQLYEKKINLIYGVGHNSYMIYKELKKKKIIINYAYDDDITKWGGEFNGVPIIDKSQLQEVLLNYNCNIIIGSLYLGTIYFNMIKFLNKIESMRSIDFFSMTEVIYRHELEALMKGISDSDILNKLKNAQGIFKDENSIQYYDFIQKIVKNENIDYWKYYTEAFCEQHQYFLDHFLNWLNGKNILDAGAYTGDTIQILENLEIVPNIVYCFEANRRNYEALEMRIQGLKIGQRVLFYNMALWSEEKELSIKLDGFRTKTSEKSQAKFERCKAIALDRFNINKKIDFVKMDIEGAEMMALQGMKNRLIKDRPILAISIYHGIEDIANIPIYLNNLLYEYEFFIRKHALAFSETILYGIPKEMKNEMNWTN